MVLGKGTVFYEQGTLVHLPGATNDRTKETTFGKWSTFESCQLLRVVHLE